MVCGARSSLNMDTLDHSDDEEQSRYANSNSSKFGKRRTKRRSGSNQPLLLMDCVGGSDNGDATEETVPLPDYERLSQSARLTDEPKDPMPPPLTPAQQQQQQQTPAKREASSPPQPPPPAQQQKPAAWRLLEYVRSRHRAAGGGAAGGYGATSSDGDSKSSDDGEREGEDGGEDGKNKDKKKKKRSSWLPDPDRRWPVQGFY